MQGLVLAAARLAALLVAVGVLSAACGDDVKPPTLQDECDPDAGQTNCDDPFECFVVSRQKNGAI
jgi:hypothetical protein